MVRKTRETLMLISILITIITINLNLVIFRISRGASFKTTLYQTQSIRISDCQPDLSKNLINHNLTENKTWREVSAEFSKKVKTSNYLQKNHLNFIYSHPKTCQPSECIAVLIPARSRDSHLKILLSILPNILINQLSCFGIYVPELSRGLSLKFICHASFVHLLLYSIELFETSAFRSVRKCL